MEKDFFGTREIKNYKKSGRITSGGTLFCGFPRLEIGYKNESCHSSYCDTQFFFHHIVMARGTNMKRVDNGNICKSIGEAAKK